MRVCQGDVLDEVQLEELLYAVPARIPFRVVLSNLRQQSVKHKAADVSQCKTKQQQMSVSGTETSPQVRCSLARLRLSAECSVGYGAGRGALVVPAVTVDCISLSERDTVNVNSAH